MAAEGHRLAEHLSSTTATRDRVAVPTTQDG